MTTKTSVTVSAPDSSMAAMGRLTVDLEKAGFCPAYRQLVFTMVGQLMDRVGAEECDRLLSETVAALAQIKEVTVTQD